MRNFASIVLLWCAALTGCGAKAPADSWDAAVAALLIGYLLGRIIHRRPRA